MMLKKFRIKYKSDNVYESLSPLYIVSRVIGISPYSTGMKNEKENKAGYEVSSVGNAYSIVFLLSFTVFYQMDSVNTSAIDQIHGNPITDKINTFQQNSGICAMAVVILMNIFKQGSVMDAVKQIEAVDANLARLGLKVNYTKRRNMFLGYVIGTVLGCMALEYTNCNMFLQQIQILSNFCYFKCVIPLVVNAIIGCQFICYVLLIKERFAILNGALRDLQENQRFKFQLPKRKQALNTVEQGYVTRTLKSVMEIHAHLCNISQQINSAYTVQVLLTIALAFIEFATHLYYCFHQMGKIWAHSDGANYFDLSTSICWTVLKLVNIFLVSLACDVTCVECGKAGPLLFKLENKFETNIGNDIDIFAKQMLHYDYKFTACGFFKIDLTLIYTTVCAAATYLIILLQFEMANDQEAHRATKNIL